MHTTPQLLDPSPLSASSLLLTLLGEFVLPGAAPVWTSALTGGLACLGVEEKAARQALARSAARGLLVSEKVGRRVRWRLSDTATALLQEGAERIHRFGRGTEQWDGRWLLVFCTVPESRRELRYRLRVRLGWAGLAPFGPGAWISPWVARQTDAVTALRELGLAEQSRTFTAALGQLGDPRRIVAEAWELDGLDADYRRFLADFAGPVAGPVAWADGCQAFTAITALVHRWRRFPTVDPELPPELLPAQWPAPAAAAAFHQRHAAWTPAAQAWWRERNGD